MQLARRGILDVPRMLPDQPPFVQDFAQIWRAAKKVVYSTTLERVSSGVVFLRYRVAT